MEKRKTKKADLEKKRTLFFQIGLIVSLSLVLAAFEWSTHLSKNNLSYNVNGIELETEMIPVTRKKELIPPQPKHFEKFEVVANNEPVKIEYILVSTEADPNEKIEFQELENNVIETNDEPMYTIPDKQAEPPGGISGLKHYLAKNIKYPTKAIEADIQGKVYVRFIVNRKGEIENVQILRGVHPLLDKEALRVVKSMPKWKPGEQAGKPVSVWFTVPIVFVLQ
ncbi:MAG: TonB family protein [Bacteroidales bacterium]|nr:TonB family protein [Bacteroidales bacterium]